jgi:carbonic anhydrase
MMPPVKTTARAVLDDLLEGNRRFREGRGGPHRYTLDEIADVAVNPEPRAALLACSDSRVAPEIVFDQPLGSLFVGRVPGNVAADSAKWMLEIAVADLRVPLVIVVGHTGCLAVRQVVEGQQTGTGGMLRFAVSTAVLRAKLREPADLFAESVRQNALLAKEQLLSDCWDLQRAVAERRTEIVAGVYDVYSGLFSVLE